ncbi:MAG: ester cyclase [Candidatus Bathyarchaeota archaeon]|nr:ester cyclase [Candidatus Bathyarchaeota archaeon]
MSLEANKTLARKFVDAYNTQNLNLVDDLVAPDFVDHTHHEQGVESLKQRLKMGFKAFSDWHETIEDIIAEGDKVWIHLLYTGTHTGEFMGVAPTGNKITAKNVDIYRIVNGKLAEYWSVTEDLNILKPMGLIEYTEQGKQLFPQS